MAGQGLLYKLSICPAEAASLGPDLWGCRGMGKKGTFSAGVLRSWEKFQPCLGETKTLFRDKRKEAQWRAWLGFGIGRCGVRTRRWEPAEPRSNADRRSLVQILAHTWRGPVLPDSWGSSYYFHFRRQGRCYDSGNDALEGVAEGTVFYSLKTLSYLHLRTT